jgi:hypothetical protein
LFTCTARGDILVGGETSSISLAMPPALLALLAEWQHSTSYNSRVQKM